MTNAIVSILINDSTIQSLVGNKEGDNTDEYKVYPLVVSQNQQPPYIVVKTLSRPPLQCKGETSVTYTPVVQVACYNVNYDDSLSMRDAVKAALDNKAAGTYNSVILSYLKYLDCSEDYILTPDGVGLFVQLPTFEGREDES